MTFVAGQTLASDLANTLGIELTGSDIAIVGVATYGSRMPQSLSYQTSAPHGETVEGLERAVICTREVAPTISASTKLISSDPRGVFMRFLASSKPDWKRTVAIQAEILGVQRGKFEAHPSAVIEDGCVIGRGALIEPLALIRFGTIVGNNTVVASGATIGAHGPAVHKSEGGQVLSWAKIHFGTVQIGNDCEVGSHTVILRAMLGRTRISNRVILGNMVHIGHGSHIGERVWMAARVTICGHVFVDRNVSIGAGATIRDNVQIGAAASVGMGSVVVSSIDPGSHVLGVPAKEVPHTLRSGPPL